MTQKVAITGPYGAIGTVLMNRLEGYERIPLDREDYDISDITRVRAGINGCYTVIHLALDPEIENIGLANVREKDDPEYHRVLARNVLNASSESDTVRRVILASSIHALNYANWKGPGYLSPDHDTELFRNKKFDPTNSYGRTKRYIEGKGREFTELDTQERDSPLEVVCVRFGGVNEEDLPLWPDYQRIYLSHRDLVNLISTILQTPVNPGSFSVVYGVSNNQTRVHDYSKPFEWTPLDDAVKIAQEKMTPT